MTEGADASPGPEEGPDAPPPSDDVPPGRPTLGRPWTAWRVVTPLAVLVSGSLFAVSALNSGGTDLRPGRYTDLAGMVRTESREYDALRDRVAAAHRRGGGADRLGRQRRGRAAARPGPRPRGTRRPGRADRSGCHRRAQRRAARGRRVQPAGPQPADRAPAGHPGRGQRAVEGRRHRRHHPGPARGQHHRHQVHRQQRAAPGRALLPALHDLRHRRPHHPRGRDRERRLPPALPQRLRGARHRRRLAGRPPSPRSAPRRTTACSTSPTR